MNINAQIDNLIAQERDLVAFRMSEKHARQLTHMAAWSFTIGAVLGAVITAVFLA